MKRVLVATATGAWPYIFLGPADYVSHDGDRPMANHMHLHQAMPMERPAP